MEATMLPFTKVYKPFQLGKCWNITPIEDEPLSGEVLPLPFTESMPIHDVMHYITKALKLEIVIN